MFVLESSHPVNHTATGMRDERIFFHIEVMT